MKRTCAILALLAVLGCSGEVKLEGTSVVSGTVKQKGTPLAGATVSFSPVGQGAGKAASGTTDAQGQFTLTTLKAGDGALPGEYQVTVVKNESVGKAYSQEESQQYYMKHQKMPPAPATKSIVAEKFTKAATSGLTASVKKGTKNEFTFEVE
jgi:hypothetical protein